MPDRSGVYFPCKPNRSKPSSQSPSLSSSKSLVSSSPKIPSSRLPPTIYFPTLIDRSPAFGVTTLWSVSDLIFSSSTDVPTEAFAAVLLRACRPTARILESLYSVPIGTVFNCHRSSSVSLHSASLVVCTNLSIALASSLAASIPPVIKKHTLSSKSISCSILLCFRLYLTAIWVACHCFTRPCLFHASPSLNRASMLTALGNSLWHGDPICSRTSFYLDDV